MNIVGLILIPFIFIINSFFIGKFFQKIKPNMNNFFSFSIGNISFVCLCSLVSLLFYMTSTIENFFPFALLTTQGILLLFYLINYRQILFLFEIDWKKIFIFLLTSLIGYLSWYFLIYLNSQPFISKQIVLNDSIFNYFLSEMFKNFNFQNVDKNIFFIYSFPFYLITCISSSVCSIFDFDKKFNIKNVVLIVMLDIFFSVLIFLKFDLLYSNWSLLFIYLPFVFSFFLKITYNFETKTNLNFFNIFLFFLIFININFIFISIILLVMLFLNYLAKNKYLLLFEMIQSFIYAIALFFIVFLKIDILISLIFLFLFIILFSLFSLYKKTQNINLKQLNYEKNIFKYNQFFLLILFLFIYLIVIIFAIQKRIVFSYNLFLFSPQMGSLINIFFSIIYFSAIVYVIFALFNYFVRKKEISYENVFLIYLIFGIFNPLFVELLKLTNISLIPTDNQLFFIFAIFFICFLYQKSIKSEYNYLEFNNRKMLLNYKIQNNFIYPFIAIGVPIVFVSSFLIL